MARRSKDWNEGLAKDLKNPEFALEFLQACLDEGISVQASLGKIVRVIGVKEFSKKSKMASPNVLRAIDPRHNPTQETLNRLLRPLGLRLSIMPIAEEKHQRRAA